MYWSTLLDKSERPNPLVRQAKLSRDVCTQCCNHLCASMGTTARFVCVQPWRPSLQLAWHVRSVLPAFRLRHCSCCNAPGPWTLRSSRQFHPPSHCEAPPDHRVIATTQQLLITSPYSPGSPLFLPHGTRIYNKLIAFLRAQYAAYGYDEVLSPSIYKRSLWDISGHWENYKEDMFEVTGSGTSGVRDEHVDEGHGEEYGLKPMNCPGHCLMFKATGASRSLRDLPVRYADFSSLHR